MGTFATFRGMCAALVAVGVSAQDIRALAQDAAGQQPFMVNFTALLTDVPRPVAVSADRDMLVLASVLTAMNAAGEGFLHNLAGRCLTWLITDKAADTVEQHGHCNYVDPDGDLIYEKVDFDLQPLGPVRVGVGQWTGGTGKYAGLRGTFEIRVTTLKPATEGIVQAVGEKRGSYTMGNPASAD